MAVDLGELTESLKSRVNPPGTNLYPDANDSQWLESLKTAFWEIRLAGVLADWTENYAVRGGPTEFGDGIITPLGETDATYDDPSGYNEDTDIPRELQQFIVMWAAWNTTLAQFQNLTSSFKAKAGPVEFEESRSATILKSILDQLYGEIRRTLSNLSTYGGSTTVVLDSVIERSYSLTSGETWWVR